MSSLDLRFAAPRVRSRPFMDAVAGAAPLSGVADVSLELLWVGGSPAEVVAALRGKGTVNVRAGEILDANLARHLGDGAETLPFEQLVGTFAVLRGVLRGDDLILQARRLSLVGAGTVDLAGNRVRIDLRTLDAGAAHDGIRPVRPFRLEGSLAGFEIHAE